MTDHVEPGKAVARVIYMKLQALTEARGLVKALDRMQAISSTCISVMRRQKICQGEF